MQDIQRELTKEKSAEDARLQQQEAQAMAAQVCVNDINVGYDFVCYSIYRLQTLGICNINTAFVSLPIKTIFLLTTHEYRPLQKRRLLSKTTSAQHRLPAAEPLPSQMHPWPCPQLNPNKFRCVFPYASLLLAWIDFV